MKIAAIAFLSLAAFSVASTAGVEYAEAKKRPVPAKRPVKKKKVLPPAPDTDTPPANPTLMGIYTLDCKSVDEATGTRQLGSATLIIGGGDVVETVSSGSFTAFSQVGAAAPLVMNNVVASGTCEGGTSRACRGISSDQSMSVTFGLFPFDQYPVSFRNLATQQVISFHRSQCEVLSH